MGNAQDALAVARHWLGYAEGPNNQTVFGEWYGMNRVPWCAEFASYCTYTSGTPCPATTPKGFAYCPSGIDWFKAHGRWFLLGPQVGDLIFYDWNGDGVSDHVGIVESVGADGVHTIEGNQNNQVERRVRTGSTILGYGRPAYGASTAPSTPATKPAPAPMHPRWPGRYLTLTSPYTKGDDVRTVQAQLNAHGERLQTDGVFGPLTVSAVKHFQTRCKLQVDGVVGPITWDALFS